MPKEIRLDLINTPPRKERFNNGNQPMAILIEGEFTSAFSNRIKPIQRTGTLEKGKANKILVIANGDIIKNQLRNGRPLKLGYDKWTNNQYGNKEIFGKCAQLPFGRYRTYKHSQQKGDCSLFG